MRDRLGHAFADSSLLRRALTHRSAGGEHNERLEFLGDGVVNLVMAEALFRRWPRADEGRLTRARAHLVRESTLAGIARELDLGALLELGPGELKSGGHRRDSILADALEAVAGAIFLDAGFDACRTAVLGWFGERLERLDGESCDKDAKTRLQEWLQARQRALPEYELLEASGEDHDKTFDVRCRIVEPSLQASARASSRRQAEQYAAQAILDQIAALPMLR